MDMSDASMGASEGGGTPMAQSPRSDDVTAASGPNVAALGEALEAPLEFTQLKASILSPEARPFQALYDACYETLEEPHATVLSPAAHLCAGHLHEKRPVSQQHAPNPSHACTLRPSSWHDTAVRGAGCSGQQSHTGLEGRALLEDCAALQAHASAA